MNVNREGSDRALEHEAEHARETLTTNIAELEERGRHAVDIAHQGELVVRRGALPLAASVLAVSALALGGSIALRLALRAGAGAIAGAGAGLVMSQVHRLFALASKKSQGEKSESEEPATTQAAEAVVGPIAEEKKELAGNVAHYAMAATTGALYGVLRELPFVASARGLAYGAAVWLFADEIMVPLLGLSPPPQEAPPSSHLRGLVAHLVYGAALDGGLRLKDLVVRAA